LTSTVRWLAVGRSLRWSPLVGAPIAAAAVVLVAGVVSGADPGRLSLAGGVARVLVCVSLAFVADDDIPMTAPGVPTTARARLTMRLVMGAATVACGWCGVFVIEAAVAPGETAFVSPGALGCAAAALAAAVLVARNVPVPSPGAVGAGLVAVALSIVMVAPEGWVAALPDATVAAIVTIAGAAAILWRATSEPVA
jgi:hypothetical protein